MVDTYMSPEVPPEVSTLEVQIELRSHGHENKARITIGLHAMLATAAWCIGDRSRLCSE